MKRRKLRISGKKQARNSVQKESKNQKLKKTKLLAMRTAKANAATNTVLMILTRMNTYMI